MEQDVDVISGSLQQLLAQFLNFLPELIASLVIFFGSLFLAGLISRGIKRALQARNADLEISIAIASMSRWTIIILGTTAALSQVGFDLTAFLAGLGIVGFTIGFALQDVSKNFVAGLLLLLQQPFDLGDAIDVAGFDGIVLKVDLRATTLRTFDGRMVQIPNGEVFTSAVVNYTRAEQRRIALHVGVAYGTDLKRAREVGLAAIRAVEGVLDDPAPRGVFQAFGDSSIDMTFYYWISTATTDLFDAQDAGILGVNTAFEKAGIEIPFPTRAVFLQQAQG
jgi:small conductance mechanosensitive channel